MAKAQNVYACVLNCEKAPKIILLDGYNSDQTGGSVAQGSSLGVGRLVLVQGISGLTNFL